MEKYSATVTEIGPYVSEFVDHNILVFFGAEAPEELKEFAILHDGTELHAKLVVGDVLELNDFSYKILAVGEVANNNLENLGHLVVKFNGETEAEMPGDVCVEAKELPEIKAGLKLNISGN